MYYSTWRNLRIGLWLGATAVASLIGFAISVPVGIFVLLLSLAFGGFVLWVLFSIAEGNLAAYDGVAPMPGFPVADLVDESDPGAVSAYQQALAEVGRPDFDSNELEPPTPVVRCPSCGAQLARYAAFCDTCGKPLPRSGSSSRRPTLGAPPSPGTP